MSFNKKHTKPRPVAKRRGKGLSGLGIKAAKALPDTSQIPWIPIKAGTTA